jgi:hypothetical protein
VDGVLGELCRWRVASHPAGFRCVGDKSFDEVLELTFRLGDVFAAVDERSELCSVVVPGFVDV